MFTMLLNILKLLQHAREMFVDINIKMCLIMLNKTYRFNGKQSVTNYFIFRIEIDIERLR